MKYIVAAAFVCDDNGYDDVMMTTAMVAMMAWIAMAMSTGAGPAFAVSLPPPSPPFCTIGSTTAGLKDSSSILRWSLQVPRCLHAAVLPFEVLQRAVARGRLFRIHANTLAAGCLLRTSMHGVALSDSGARPQTFKEAL